MISSPPSRLLPLPESVVQQPCGSARPRHAAFYLHVASSGGPWHPAGAPHGVAAPGVPGQTSGVRHPDPDRHTPHHIVSSSWISSSHWESRLLLGRTLGFVTETFCLLLQRVRLQQARAGGACSLLGGVDDGDLETGSLQLQGPLRSVCTSLGAQG